jgi:hypothetical protein
MFERIPIFVFENENSIGLNIVPLNSLVLIECSGKLYQFIDNNNVSSSSTLGSVNGVNILEYKNLQKLYSKVLFYNGSSGAIVTILSSTATLVQVETSIGTARNYLSGASSGSNALFYGGWSATNLVTILSSIGALVQAESNVGTARYLWNSGSTSGTNALFYGGWTSTCVSLITLISITANLIQAESSVGTRRKTNGTNHMINSVFYGGYCDGGDLTFNTCTLISPTATLVQVESNVGTASTDSGGANVGTNALFYAGKLATTNYNKTTLISPTATLVQIEVNIGTARNGLTGANVGVNALFYGGYLLNIATLLSPIAVLVQAETTVGVTVAYRSGASL